MIGGTLLIRCEKEDFQKFVGNHSNLQSRYDENFPSGINYSMAYEEELNGIIFEYESNLTNRWSDENRSRLSQKIETWLALGKVAEMNRWWIDERYKEKVGLRDMAKYDTEVMRKWKKFHKETVLG